MCCEPRSTVIVLSVLHILGLCIPIYTGETVTQITAVGMLIANFIILGASITEEEKAWKMAKFAEIFLMSMTVLCTLYFAILTDKILPEKSRRYYGDDFSDILDKFQPNSLIFVVISGCVAFLVETIKYCAIVKCWSAVVNAPAPNIPAQGKNLKQLADPDAPPSYESIIQYQHSNQKNQLPYPDAPPSYASAIQRQQMDKKF